MYKAIVNNVIHGKEIGACVLCQDFKTMDEAIREAETHVIGEQYAIRIIGYDESKPFTVAPGYEIDTGVTVYDDFGNTKDLRARNQMEEEEIER